MDTQFLNTFVVVADRGSMAAAALCAMVEGFARHWFGRGEDHDEATAVATLTQLWAGALDLRTT